MDPPKGQLDLDINNRIKYLTNQTLCSSNRILTYCNSSEKLGVETTRKLNEQYDKIKNIHEDLEQMDEDLKWVEKNLKELRKSRLRSFLDTFCCCCCGSSSSAASYSLERRRKSTAEIIDSECSLKSESTSTVPAAASTTRMAQNASRSDTFLQRRARATTHNNNSTTRRRHKTKSLVNLPARSSSRTSVRRSLKSIKSILSGFRASSLKLVKSTSVSLHLAKRSSGSVEQIERNLDLNLRTINSQLDSLQAMSIDIAKRIEKKNGYLNQVNHYADINIERVKSADNVGRKLWIKKKK